MTAPSKVECQKLCHRSPAAARKWFRLTGGGYAAKHLYQCLRHGDEVVWHYTRAKPANTDPRLQGLVAYTLQK